MPFGQAEVRLGNRIDMGTVRWFFGAVWWVDDGNGVAEWWRSRKSCLGCFFSDCVAAMWIWMMLARIILVIHDARESKAETPAVTACLLLLSGVYLGGRQSCDLHILMRIIMNVNNVIIKMIIR